MNQLFHVKDFLIETVDWLNPLNCDIDNLSVFDEASMNADVNPYCAVISHTFSDEGYQSGDVNNILFDWRVIINVFRLLEGSRDENAEQIQEAYLHVREVIDALSTDFSLGGRVLDGKLHSVLTPMTYSRNDRDEYIMVGIVIIVKELING